MTDVVESCSNVSEVTLNDMGILDGNQTIAMHNKLNHMLTYWGMLYMLQNKWGFHMARTTRYMT